MNVFGIGTDIVECLRIAKMIERHGEQFITRVYTAHEIEHCSQQKSATQHYAGRWAAKEAVLKALGTGWTSGIHWNDIEIQHQPQGKPIVRLAGGAREACENLRVAEILVAVSHCRSHATAYAMAMCED